MPNTRQSDDTLNKKLEELATKKDIEQLKNQWNILKRLHPNISLVELSPRSLKLLVKSDILSNY